jgi:pseudouridine-5'-phosphate glycosidase
MYIHPEIQLAVSEGRPVVALESALITHGFAYPANLAITRDMAAVVRENGAVPAVIGVWRGVPTVGLSDAQLQTLAAVEEVHKVSVRDLSLVGLRGGHGGTTVAATAVLANRAGIRVFATGGIGGVHRGHPEDISADLPTLASTSLVVVCAGAKAILDLPRTLEFLETWGVPVLGWQTETFAAFYSRSSGLPVDQAVDEGEDVAAVYAAQRGLRLRQGVLVAVPVPVADEVPSEEIEPLIAQALSEVEEKGITGRAVTPYLLERLVALSDTRTQRANEALLLNNARVAAQIAGALAE